MSTLSIATRIVQSPEMMENQPHIEGRRIRVKDIVLWFESLAMSADEIAYYIRTCNHFNKAGSYGAQDWIGHCKITRIECTFQNVMGLPVDLV